MSEQTELLKKAVLAGVGASTNVERIKSAVTSAMQDLVKVGQDLFDDLEVTGKDKTESLQQFLKNLQEEATKRTQETEKKVVSKVQDSTRKYVKDFGLATREDIEEIFERLCALEEAVHGPCENGEGGEEGSGKKRGRKRHRES